MPLVRPLFASAALTSAAVAGCRSSTAPVSSTPETYLLRSVGGVPLPVATQNPAGQPRDLGVEFLYLYGDGSFVLSTGLLPPGRRASEAPGESVERRGRYARGGGQLTLRFMCAPADPGCPAPYVGTADAARADLREANGAGTVRAYERGYEL